MDSNAQGDHHREIRNLININNACPHDYSALVQALHDAHEQHTQQIKVILTEIHDRQEQRLISAADHAIRQAFAELQLSSAQPQTVVLPVTIEGSSTSASVKEHTKGSSTSASVNEHTKAPTEFTKGEEEEGEEEAVGQVPKGEVNPHVYGMESSVHAVKSKGGGLKSLVRVNTFMSLEKRWEKTLEKILSHTWFDYVLAMFIIANAIVIAMQTETAAQNPQKKLPETFNWIDLFFTVFFSVELAARILVEKSRFITGRNKAWNLFDLFIVCNALLEVVMSASRNTTAIRVLRIMRLVRVVRVMRTLRIFNDLRSMVRGIMTSIISLVWAVVLLFLILFVIGILVTQVVTSHRQTVDIHPQPSSTIEPSVDSHLEESFGSLGKTMYSLYKSVTGGDDWATYADPLFEVSPILGVSFCLYVAFATLAVLNVITGVFVDNAIKANRDDADMVIIEQTEARKKHIAEVKSIFMKADTDVSGKLNLEEFQMHMDNPFVQAYFRQLGLDIEGSGAASLFNMLDFDSSGLIDVEEFIFGCGHLKGYARSLDLARMGHGQRLVTKELVDYAKEQSRRIDAVLAQTAVVRQALLNVEKKLESKLHKKTEKKMYNTDQNRHWDLPASMNGMHKHLPLHSNKTAIAESSSDCAAVTDGPVYPPANVPGALDGTSDFSPKSAALQEIA